MIPSLLHPCIIAKSRENTVTIADVDFQNTRAQKSQKLLIKTESGIEYSLKTAIQTWGEKKLIFPVGKLLGL